MARGIKVAWRAMSPRTIEERWRWWRETLGSPRYAMAPMVLQSELAFRVLARRHGCELCYSPMLPASAFLEAAATGRPEHPDTGGPATREAGVVLPSRILVDSETRAGALSNMSGCIPGYPCGGDRVFFQMGPITSAPPAGTTAWIYNSSS